MGERPTLWLIAGPNGVGKTSYARRYLRAVAGTERFLNLDEIARGLSPLTPTPDAETAAAAARALLRHAHENIARGRGFALETTLAGRTHLRMVAAARAAGFAAYAAICDLWRVLDTQQAEPRLVMAGPPAGIADPALFAGLPPPLRQGLGPWFAQP